MEQDWTECHNIMLHKSGVIMDKVKLTFEDYGLTDDKGIPFELSFKLCLDGSGKRGRIVGPKFTPVAQAKIARLPGCIQTLVNARFGDEDIKTFMTNLSNEKIEQFAELWDHSRINTKYKVDQLLLEEPNIKCVDEVSELVGAFSEEFKDRFKASFTSEKIGEELKYQIRTRSEAAAADAAM